MKMKLSSILQELFDSIPITSTDSTKYSTKPYDIGVPKVDRSKPFSDGSTNVEYVFQFTNANVDNNNTEVKKNMDITIQLQREAQGEKPVMIMSFGKIGPTDKKYSVTTGKGDLIRIFATLIKAADEVIKDENVPGGRDGLYAISYSASGKRDLIYQYFIQRYFPNFELSKKGTKFPMFVNRDYKNRVDPLDT